MLPFSRDAFLEVFRSYNEEVWPMQLGLFAAAVAATALAIRGTELASRMTLALLAALWLWMAITYYWLFFTRINPAAWIFGALFACQAWLLGRAAVRGVVSFGGRRGPSAWLGGAAVGYALIVYPVLGQLGDHPYPRSPSFGMPCPTTIFTLGLLLLTRGRVPWWLIVIPAVWAAIGTSAAITLGIREDLGLAAAALALMVVLSLRGHR